MIYHGRIQIGNGTVIDDGCQIGDCSRIWHNCVIRSNVKIGFEVTIGHLVVIEADAEIGNWTTIQSQCHITKGAKIGKSVFFGPGVICINEKNIASHGRSIEQKLEGPEIGDGARIGAGTIIAPGIRIGEQAKIAMGSLITHDIPPFEYWRGYPAKRVSTVPCEERI